MKTFKTIFLGAALIFGLGACNNGDAIENIDTTETKTVRVSLKFDAPKTYAEGDAVSVGGPITLTNADLFFVTSNADDGVIVKIEKLNESDDSGDDGVLTKDIEVPVVASYVYAVANYSAADENDATTKLSTIKVGDALSALKAADLLVKNQVKDDNDVYMFGGQAVAATTDIQLSSNVARIEIAQFSLKSGSEISDFDVTGIFLTGFYTKATLDGVCVGENPTWPVQSSTEGLSADMMAKADDGGEFDDDLLSAVYDLGTWTYSDNKVVPSEAVWGYNLFTSSGKNVFPHIIVRIENLEVGGQAISGPHFITIDKVQKTEAGNETVSTLLGGNVYTFGDIQFDETNLGKLPYAAALEATVTVTPMSWTQVEVKPNL